MAAAAVAAEYAALEAVSADEMVKKYHG